LPIGDSSTKDFLNDVIKDNFNQICLHLQQRRHAWIVILVKRESSIQILFFIGKVYKLYLYRYAQAHLSCPVRRIGILTGDGCLRSDGVPGNGSRKLQVSVVADQLKLCVSLKEILELLCKQLSHIGRSPARIIEEVVDRKGLGDIVVNGSARKAVFHLAAGGQKHNQNPSQGKYPFIQSHIV